MSDSTEQKTRTPEIIKTHCYKCDHDTNQDTLFTDFILGPREIIWRNDEGDEAQSVWEVVGKIWTLSKCRGCEEINFKHTQRNSPDRNTDEVFYLPRKPIRRPPSWILKLPVKYLDILQEVYAAINNNMNILSLTGIRTLLDIYIVNKIGDAGTFKQKLDKLASGGFVTLAKVKVLEAAIEAGNASAHRGYKPAEETLFQILDIVENLLESELVDRATDRIKQKTPSRKLK